MFCIRPEVENDWDQLSGIEITKLSIFTCLVTIVPSIYAALGPLGLGVSVGVLILLAGLTDLVSTGTGNHNLDR